jgi:alpha-galactosidase
VTQKHDRPLLHNFGRNTILDYLDRMRDAGFYDVLHLDLGWEAKWPMAVDAEKFPNGLGEIVRRAYDYGIDMGFWVNPFSCSYWKSKMQDEHPEYIVPGKVSQRSGANALCIMTDYFDYVQKRFVDLVTEANARAIFWDGNDWNIPECTARNHSHRDQDELVIKAIKRLAEICEAAHEARPTLSYPRSACRSITIACARWTRRPSPTRTHSRRFSRSSSSASRCIR